MCLWEHGHGQDVLPRGMLERYGEMVPTDMLLRRKTKIDVGPAQTMFALSMVFGSKTLSGTVVRPLAALALSPGLGLCIGLAV